MRLIDADELIKAIHDEWDEVLVWDESGEATAREFEGLVCELPTVEAEPVRHGQWIPVTEQLPEINGRYLVTRGLNACGSLWKRVYIANYSDLMGLKSKKIWWQGNVGKSDFERLDDVVAWMPLPKPYKGERREDGKTD